MNILAIIATRNEAAYVTKCISYLVDQGIKVALIDNASDDRSVALARSFGSESVPVIENYPYPGYYDWVGILKLKERIRSEFPCDWVIHHDVDEIMESSRPGESLAEGIRRIDSLGYEAANFDEFVFLPEDSLSNYEGQDYYRSMRYYYFFEPSKTRLVRAFKNDPTISNVSTGGHRLRGREVRISPENFVLRHYICLSAEHARRKYLSRIYSPTELALGWHGNRVTINQANLALPDRSQLHVLYQNSFPTYCRLNARKQHFWDWSSSTDPL